MGGLSVTALGDGKAGVAFAGILDEQSAREAAAALVGAPHGVAFEIDMTGLTFLDSAGLTAVLTFLVQRNRAGQPTRVIVEAGGTVERVVDMTGVIPVLEHCELLRRDPAA